MIDDKVHNIVKQMSSYRDGNFMLNIVRSFSLVVDADYAFVSRSVKDAEYKAETIAFSEKDKILENLRYDFQGAPCQLVLSGVSVLEEYGAREKYPNTETLDSLAIEGYIGTPLYNSKGEIFGIVVALYKKPIKDIKAAESLLLLFSGLIGSELERLDQHRELVLANNIVDRTSGAVLIADASGKLIQVNDAFTDLVGYSLDDVKGLPYLWASDISDTEKETVHKRLIEDGTWDGELWVRRKNGVGFPASASLSSVVCPVSGSVTNIIGRFMDVSSRKKTEQQLHFQTNFDALTKLANRQLFMDRLSHTISSCKRTSTPFAVLVLGLDFFKGINDTYGHSLGDKLLVRVAQRIRKYSRQSDTVARLASDEFAIIAEEISTPDDAAALGAAIVECIRQPFFIGGHTILITASVGITLYPYDGDADELLLSYADQAMHSVKSANKDGFRFFKSEMQSFTEKRMFIKSKLSQSIDNYDFNLVYQPILNLETGRFDKLEALLRWQYNGKNISPGSFIPTAEEFGLIVPIGEHVLELACSSLKRLRDEGFKDIVMSINRSVKELTFEDHYHPSWLDTINSHGVPANSIEFELTESVLAPENDQQIQYLKLLRDAGVRIAIDDFGTGYSSLSYLRRFSADVIKIDKSFITHLHEKQDDRVLVSTVIAMAKALGVSVVAEGVELEAQLQVLSELKCDSAQGFHIARPMSIDSVLKLLAGHNKGQGSNRKLFAVK